jgi:hypothetical protein
VGTIELLQKELLRYSVRSGMRIVVSGNGAGFSGSQVQFRTAPKTRVEAGVDVSFSLGGGKATASIEVSGPVLFFEGGEALLVDVTSSILGADGDFFNLELELFVDVAVYPVDVSYFTVAEQLSKGADICKYSAPPDSVASQRLAASVIVHCTRGTPTMCTTLDPVYTPSVRLPFVGKFCLSDIDGILPVEPRLFSTISEKDLKSKSLGDHTWNQLDLDASLNVGMETCLEYDLSDGFGEAKLSLAMTLTAIVNFDFGFYIPDSISHGEQFICFPFRESLAVNEVAIFQNTMLTYSTVSGVQIRATSHAAWAKSSFQVSGANMRLSANLNSRYDALKGEATIDASNITLAHDKESVFVFTVDLIDSVGSDITKLAEQVNGSIIIQAEVFTVVAFYSGSRSIDESAFVASPCSFQPVGSLAEKRVSIHLELVCRVFGDDSITFECDQHDPVFKSNRKGRNVHLQPDGPGPKSNASSSKTFANTTDGPNRVAYHQARMVGSNMNMGSGRSAIVRKQHGRSGTLVNTGGGAPRYHHIGVLQYLQARQRAPSDHKHSLKSSQFSARSIDLHLRKQSQIVTHSAENTHNNHSQVSGPHSVLRSSRSSQLKHTRPSARNHNMLSRKRKTGVLRQAYNHLQTTSQSSRVTSDSQVVSSGGAWAVAIQRKHVLHSAVLDKWRHTPSPIYFPSSGLPAISFLSGSSDDFSRKGIRTRRQATTKGDEVDVSKILSGIPMVGPFKGFDLKGFFDSLPFKIVFVQNDLSLCRAAERSARRHNAASQCQANWQAAGVSTTATTTTTTTTTTTKTTTSNTASTSNTTLAPTTDPCSIEGFAASALWFRFRSLSADYHIEPEFSLPNGLFEPLLDLKIGARVAIDATARIGSSSGGGPTIGAIFGSSLRRPAVLIGKMRRDACKSAQGVVGETTISDSCDASRFFPEKEVPFVLTFDSTTRYNLVLEFVPGRNLRDAMESALQKATCASLNLTIGCGTHPHMPKTDLLGVGHDCIVAFHYTPNKLSWSLTAFGFNRFGIEVSKDKFSATKTTNFETIWIKSKTAKAQSYDVGFQDVEASADVMLRATSIETQPISARMLAVGVEIKAAQFEARASATVGLSFAADPAKNSERDRTVLLDELKSAAFGQNSLSWGNVMQAELQLDAGMRLVEPSLLLGSRQISLPGAAPTIRGTLGYTTESAQQHLDKVCSELASDAKTNHPPDTNAEASGKIHGPVANSWLEPQTGTCNGVRYARRDDPPTGFAVTWTGGSTSYTAVAASTKQWTKLAWPQDRPTLQGQSVQLASPLDASTALLNKINTGVWVLVVQRDPVGNAKTGVGDSSCFVWREGRFCSTHLSDTHATNALAHPHEHTPDLHFSVTHQSISLCLLTNRRTVWNESASC